MAKNSFLDSPLETVTDSIRAQKFELPPLPEIKTAAPAPATAPVADARQPARADRFLPPDDFRPIFEAAAREFDVPVNVLMALGHQESRYNPNAIGQPTQWGRAKGMMQYIDDTAAAMGINPFNPAEAIPAAAKQLAERLKKGYSMEDAVKEHFAGPDRKLWGEKTAAYGREVMEKVGRIGELMGAGASGPAAAPEAEEPGRYVPLTAEQVAQVEAGGDPFKLPEPAKAPAEERGFFERNLDYLGADIKIGWNNLLNSFEGMRTSEYGELLQSFKSKYTPEQIAADPKLQAELKVREDGYARSMGEITKRNKINEKLHGEMRPETRQFFSSSGKPTMEQLATIGDAVMKNPVGVITDLGVQSGPQSLAMVAAAIVARLSGGTAGAAAVAGGGTSAALQFGGDYAELRNEGRSHEDAWRTAAAKSAVVGAFDAVSMNSAGKALDAVLGAGGVVKKAGTVAKELGKQSALGMAGEAGGSVASGRPIDATSVAAEGLGELFGGPIEAIGTFRQGGKPAEPPPNEAAPAPAAVPVTPEAPPSAQAAPAPAAPTVTVTPPEPSQATGPLSRAVENAATEPARVTAETPFGPISGFVLSHTEDAGGNFETRILGDDGQAYTFSSADGVQITPEAGPLTKAVEQAAEQAAPAATPEQNQEVAQDIRGSQTANAEQSATDTTGLAGMGKGAADAITGNMYGGLFDALKDGKDKFSGVKDPVLARAKPYYDAGLIRSPEDLRKFENDGYPELPKPEPRLEDMTEPELRDRLKYIAGQGKTNGWNKLLTDERKKVEAQINKRTAEAKRAAEAPKAEEIDLTGRTLQQLEYLSTNGKDGFKEAALAEIQRRTEKGAEDGRDATDLPVRDVSEPGAEAAAPVKGDQPGAGAGTQADDAGWRAAAAAPDAGAATAVSGADQAADANPALKDEHAGKWFGSREKADAYLAKRKITGTHEVTQTGKVRFEVKPKQPAAPEVGVKTPVVERDKPKEQTNAQPAADAIPAELVRADGDVGGAAAQAVGQSDGGKPVAAQGKGNAESLPSEAAKEKKVGAGETAATDKPGVVNVPQPVADAISNQMQKQKGRITRLKNEASKAESLEDKKAAQLKVTAAEATLRKMRQSIFDAEDAAIKAVETGDVSAFAAHADIFPDANNALLELTGQNDELDAEMRSYERKAEAKAKPAVSENKVFTEDAATKARALLKSKLGQLNSGIDPEMMQAGLTLAGYHIEKGARTFAAYAKAMIADLGDSVKPYLKSWYMGVKYDPRAAAFEGMSTAADVEAADINVILANTEASPILEVKEAQNGNETEAAGGTGDRALEGEPAQQARGAESGGNAEQRSDAGGGTDAGGTVQADRAGDTGRGGVGDGARDVPVPARGRRGKRGSAGERGLQAELGIEPAGQRDVEVAEARREPEAAGDYRITDLTRLGEGGQKTKYRNNVAAIKLLNDLQASGRKATAEEQDTLARYVGWGGIPQAFDEANTEWAKEYAELKELLTPEEWGAAVESTQYAHYTSQEIIGGMYGALKRFGVAGGRFMEPGAGVGNFIGLMPEGLRSGSRFTAVERERIAGGIAKLLYPGQNVQQQDFRNFNAQDGYFDVAIGNPPFASTSLTDLSGRKHLSGLSIHNYFFAKSVDMLREGGVLAMVVSNSFLDAKGDKARRYIGERTELLGAIRLPNKAFAKNANTEVTTDIIFLKKRPEAEWGSKVAKDDLKRWQALGTVPDPLGGEPIPLNQYFIDHPEMMLGRMERAGSMYRADQPALIASQGADVGTLMQDAINRLPEGVYVSAVVQNTASMEAAKVVALDDAARVDVGGHYVKDGSVFVRLPDVAGEGRAMQVTASTKISEKRDLGANGLERIKHLAEMRVTVRKLLAAEMKDGSNIEELRATLNEQYDAYVKENGYINQRGTVQVFGDDPDFPLLASLEHGFDPGIGAAAAKSQGIKPVAASARKAPIFSRRVIERHEEITTASTPEDALMISIAERGQIDPGYIGSLLNRDGAAVLEELTKGDKPALFIDPATNGYVLRDAYLSGNVRKKVKQAKSAGMYRNVAELEKVVPEDIPAHEISGKIGAPWVPPAVYEQFAQEIMGEGTRARIVYVPAMSSYVASFEAGSDVSNTNTFGTKRMGADEIYAALLNSKEIKVGHYEEDDNGSRRFVLEKEPTDEANDKAREIKDKFNDWLFADGERAEKMQRAYNDAVNNYVTRVFDGSMLKLPGKVPDVIIKLRRHQRNAVARIIQDGRALLDHVVGAGKTYTIIAAAMEMKRTGLAMKPMIVVPNHLVKQWAADFYRLYPGANILTATKKDFEKANRRKFLAKIATGNWDAVIMAHSSFGFIKPDQDFELRFNQERIDEIVEAMQALKDEKDQQSKRTVKQLAKMKENLENKLASLRDKPMDDLLDLGQIGVDNVFVDEAHLFKNLMFVTKMQNVRGLGQPKGSQRAYDMFIKTHQIYEKNGNVRGIVFATGTPVSNSLAEMYHMLRYLAPETLKDSGQFTFDAWAKTFADVEQVWMQSLSGDGYKSSNRMSRFVNTPELLRAYDQVADTVTIEDIKTAFAEENDGKEFPIPKQKGGRRTPVSIPRTPEQTEYMGEIAKRAKALEQRKGKPQKGDDNMLSIMGDARKSAMDIRMVRPDIKERDPNGRIAIAARNIFDRYQKYNDVRGTQLVFSDMGTPKKHAEKELKEYNELMAQVAPLSDDKVLAMAELGDEAAQEQIEDAEEAQRKIDAKGQDWLDAIKAAMRGFSIYDDMRDALIELGIPEREIAFIHDYNTDDQKAALFRAVNDGKARVILGSTEKMGAGTNVQERAVALHHLDVPWKPSDIEQREGRVIRQGNKLLDELKDFEVEVLAYATQDTLDLFMWQTQEKKLSMIGQLRTGNVGREFDNAFEEMQMSAGEMQAAATSNPYLLEEIQLKDKVKKLERQKRSFDGQKNDLENRKRKAEKDVSDLPGQIKQAEKIEKAADSTIGEINKHFAELKATVDKQTVTGVQNIRSALREAINAAPMVEKDGKETRQIAIEFNGKEYTSESSLADAANKALGDAAEIAYTLPSGETVYRGAEVVAGLIDPIANMMEAGTSNTELGKVGAFEVTAYRIADGKFDVIVSLNGDDVGDYEVRFDPKEPGGLNAQLRAIPANASKIIQSSIGLPDFLQSKLERAKRTLADVESKPSAGAWEGDAELKKARDDYKAVLKKLAERDGDKSEVTPEADEPRYSVAPDGSTVAEFGPVTEAYRNDPAGAVRYLLEQKTGEAIVNHPTLGEISIVYGDGTMGLSHIAARHGENFLRSLPAVIGSGQLYAKPNQEGRVFIGTAEDEAAIRLDWNGQAKAWLVSAYEKHPDLSAAADPRASMRSETIKARTGLDVAGLNRAVTAGAIGPAIQDMIDRGGIVLHRDASTLPAKGARSVQAVTLENGQIHLVASALTAENARAVMLHEMFHRGAEPLVGSREWGNLMGRMGSLYRQSEQSSGKAREFFDRARARVAAAKRQGAVSTRMEVEEFAAYAIEEWERAPDSLPAAIRKWVEDFIGALKAFFLARVGRQLGDVTPAQLAGLAKLVITDAQMVRVYGPIATAGFRFSVAPEQALAEAEAALDEPKAKDDYIGTIIGDLSTLSKYGNTPMHIAAMHKEAVPAVRTGLSQMETRDRNVADFGADFHAYVHLNQASKETVNKVLELGRLMSVVYTADELTNGVVNTGETKTVEMVDGKPKMVSTPITAALTAPGEVVKLSADEIEAYRDLRKLFDRALDRIRAQTLDEMGFAGFAPMKGMKPLMIEDTEDGKIVLKGSVYTDEEKAQLREAAGNKAEIAKVLKNNPVAVVMRKFDGARWNPEKLGYEFDARQRPALEKELGAYLQKSAAAQILELIDKQTPPDQAERLKNIATFVAEIEQAKRAGYVPFARYGDYVVAVKERIAEAEYIEDSKDRYIVHGLPESFADDMLAMGAEPAPKSEGGGWHIKKSQRRAVEKLTEKTVYSEKVELSLTDKVRYEKKDVNALDIPAVKAAHDRAVAAWKDGHPGRRMYVDKIQKKPVEKGMSLSDFTSLAEEADINGDTLEQVKDKLADAIQARGFRKHLFHSNNVPGYTGDFERSIADYIISASGYLSRRAHAKRWDSALEAAKKKPELHAYLSDYRDYLNNPQEEFAMMRQVGFMMYIAGVNATAFANLTQVAMTTVPTLTQMAPTALVMKEVGSAYIDAGKMFTLSNGLALIDISKAPADLKQIIEEADSEGFFVPLETIELTATSTQRNVGARRGMKAFNTGVQIASLTFTAAERMNRLVTFIAAARLAAKPAVQANAKKRMSGNAMFKDRVLRDWSQKNFAEWLVDETQYRMGKANRAKMMRGVGAPLMQFKGYLLNTFELLYRNAKNGREGKKAMLASLLVMYALAGIWGIPGADDLRKLIENIYKTLTDKDLDMKTELRAWIARSAAVNAIAGITNALTGIDEGKVKYAASSAITKGASYPLGVDLTRVGMGSVVPQSPLAAAGIPFDMLIGRPKRAFEKAAAGDAIGATAEFTPNFIKHWLVSGSWALDGVRDKQGNRILTPGELSFGDLAMKTQGFQPSIVTDIRDYEYAQRRMETSADALKRSYANKLAKAMAQEEKATNPKELEELNSRIGELYAEIDKHNETASEEQYIRIDRRSLRNKIQRELDGVKSTWGRERKAARGSSEEMRDLFGLSQEDYE